jgi:hypothetical protein
MEQQPGYNHAPQPAPKKSNRKWIIIIAILVVLCVCVGLILALIGGYFYLNNQTVDNAQGSQPQTNGSIPAINTVDLAKSGGISIPFTLKAPDGITVVDQGVFLAIDKSDPEFCHLYISFVLKGSKAMDGVTLNYKIWTNNGEENLFLKSSNSTYAIIPIGQTTGYFWHYANLFTTLDKPSKMEITIEMKDPSKNKNDQKRLDKLGNTSFPNPYFTVSAADLVIGDKDANGLYQIEAKGKLKNNLPKGNHAAGLFVFYDNKGTVVGMSSSNCDGDNLCNGMGALDLDPQSEGEVKTILPYLLKKAPAKVTLYQLLDVTMVINLPDIK